MSEEQRAGEILHDHLLELAKICREAGQGGYTASVILRAHVNRDGRIEVGNKELVGRLLQVARRMEPPGRAT